MVVADTSVWIEHFRRGEPQLASLLSSNQVLMHPFVIGELACGYLKPRAATLYQLKSLPSCSVAGNAEVLHLIESRKLFGRGLGWTDVHLLASALLSHSPLWSIDKSLSKAAADLNIQY